MKAHAAKIGGRSKLNDTNDLADTSMPANPDLD